MKTSLSMDLQGHVAVVTGAANGLGEGSAMALARCGADVVIADKDVDNGERVAEKIRTLGQKAVFVPADMMVAESIENLCTQVKEKFGFVNVLVNNVGGGRPQNFITQSKNSIQRHINLNFMSVLLTTQMIVPMMVEQGKGGTIINVASTEALRAAPGFAVYAACKAAVVNFTKTMALELAADGIRSFALAPDMIKTPGLSPLMNTATPEQAAARDRYIPNGRVGSIEEFGQVVAFLASDMASYLNGVTIPVDAGATAAAGWYRNIENEWCLYHAS